MRFKGGGCDFSFPLRMLCGGDTGLQFLGLEGGAALAANAKNVEEYRAGKDKAFNALVGQVMKATKGKASPAQVNELLKKKLAG